MKIVTTLPGERIDRRSLTTAGIVKIRDRTRPRQARMEAPESHPHLIRTVASIFSYPSRNTRFWPLGTETLDNLNGQVMNTCFPHVRPGIQWATFLGQEPGQKDVPRTDETQPSVGRASRRDEDGQTLGGAPA